MRRLVLFLMLLVTACQGDEPLPTASLTPSPLEASPMAVERATKASTPRPLRPAASPTYTLAVPSMEVTASPTDTPIPPTPSFTVSPDPAAYEPYTIDFLRSRTYGGGNLEVTEVVEENEAFTRYFIRYPSDGLNIYGFANVPKGDGPFPVIIGIHGYIDPAIYETLDYTTSALDEFTRRGYIVIHPNLRGYPPSDNGDNLFRVGMAVDVLNLMALLKAQAGPPELFATAAPEAIGLWGHSMGGNIILRVLTVSPDVKAAVLFASMSGDELENAAVLAGASSDPTFQAELAAPPLALERISPMYFYHHITAPIQLHHGSLDETIPVASAEETCYAITAAGAQIECIYYPTEEHTFRSRVGEQLFGAVFQFYQTYLVP